MSRIEASAATAVLLLLPAAADGIDPRIDRSNNWSIDWLALLLASSITQ
jgi:hypothetical protein